MAFTKSSLTTWNEIDPAIQLEAIAEAQQVMSRLRWFGAKKPTVATDNVDPLTNVDAFPRYFTLGDLLDQPVSIWLEAEYTFGNDIWEFVPELNFVRYNDEFINMRMIEPFAYMQAVRMLALAIVQDDYCAADSFEDTYGSYASKGNVQITRQYNEDFRRLPMNLPRNVYDTIVPYIKSSYQR